VGQGERLVRRAAHERFPATRGYPRRPLAGAAPPPAGGRGRGPLRPGLPGRPVRPLTLATDGTPRVGDAEIQIRLRILVALGSRPDDGRRSGPPGGHRAPPTRSPEATSQPAADRSTADLHRPISSRLGPARPIQSLLASAVRIAGEETAIYAERTVQTTRGGTVSPCQPERLPSVRGSGLALLWRHDWNIILCM
jgi:hypothetical protein